MFNSFGFSLLGNGALWFALISALLQSIPLLTSGKNPYLLAIARPSALSQFCFITLAYLLLTMAFLNNDFSLAYVAANSHSSLPLMYQLTAVWGGHEGSLLLWIFILNLWTMACLYRLSAMDRYFSARTLAFLGMISVSFISFLIFTSNPFQVATEIRSGADLNPLLQDPGFVIHPPMLYMGYVGFSVTFALALAARSSSSIHTANLAWLTLTRQFAIIAWCFLTLGILLGSWWAYRVLGWGGFWFWDPVENASLLPWIAGAALIHVLVLTTKRHIAKNWATLLSIICFSLSLLGTFLVRSGILISVHSFATDPTRGIFLLLLLTFLLTLACLIFFSQKPRATSTPPLKLFSRETSLLLNSVLLFIVLLTILLGTLYPLILQALQLNIISVGAPYFNSVLTPLVFILLAFMGLAPFFSWREELNQHLWQKIWKKLLLSVIVASVITFFLTPIIDLTTFLGLALSFWVILSIIPKEQFFSGLSFGHLGFVVLFLGILLSSLLSIEKEVRLQPGHSVYLGPYQFHFVEINGYDGPNYRSVRGHFSIFKQARHITELYPEKRIYPIRDMVMSKADIHPGIFRDLYLTLGEPLENKSWSVHLYYKPFIRWIWFGGLLMIGGGLLALWQRQGKSV